MHILALHENMLRFLQSHCLTESRIIKNTKCDRATVKSWRFTILVYATLSFGLISLF